MIQIEYERFPTYQAILTHCPSKGLKTTTSSLLNCCQMGSVKRLLVISNSWDIVVQNWQTWGGNISLHTKKNFSFKFFSSLLCFQFAGHLATEELMADGGNLALGSHQWDLVAREIWDKLIKALQSWKRDNHHQSSQTGFCDYIILCDDLQTVDAMVGSKGKEAFRRPLCSTCTGSLISRSLSHAAFVQSLARCPSRYHHLALDCLGMVPLLGWSHAKTWWSKVSSCCTAVSPLYRHSAGEHVVAHFSKNSPPDFPLQSYLI